MRTMKRTSVTSAAIGLVAAGLVTVTIASSSSAAASPIAPPACSSCDQGGGCTVGKAACNSGCQSCPSPAVRQPAMRQRQHLHVPRQPARNFFRWLLGSRPASAG